MWLRHIRTRPSLRATRKRLLARRYATGIHSRLPHPLDHPGSHELGAERLDFIDRQAERVGCGGERAPGVLVEPLEELQVSVFVSQSPRIRRRVPRRELGDPSGRPMLAPRHVIRGEGRVSSSS